MSDTTIFFVAFGATLVASLLPLVLSHYLLDENRGGWL